MNSKLTDKFWAKYFRYYDVLNELLVYRALMDSLVEHLSISSDDIILDLGAGTCNLGQAINRSGIRPHNMVGVDISREGLDVCNKKANWIETRRLDITAKLPFADEEFSKVVSNNVLYAISKDERPEILREVHRILKPGGEVIMSNILTGFKPINIYISEVKTSIVEMGFFRTIYRMIYFVYPSIKIMYYNSLINKEHGVGSYDLFDVGEQAEELEQAGFSIVNTIDGLYAGQSELVRAVKN